MATTVTPAPATAGAPLSRHSTLQDTTYDVETVDPHKHPRRRRRVCFCFPSRKVCWLTFCLIFLVILGLIGFLLWYFWPTVPQYGYFGPYVPTTAEGFSTAPGSKWQPGPQVPTTIESVLASSMLAISMGMGLDVWINNQNNRFDIDLDRLDVVGRVKDEQGNFMDTNKVNLTINMIDVTFPKNTNTTVKVPLFMQFSTPISDLLQNKDPFLQLLSTSCQVPFFNLRPSGPSPLPIVMEFDINVAPSAARRLGIDIDRTIGPFSTTCPPQLQDALRRASGVLEPLMTSGLGAVVPQRRSLT